MTIVSNEGNLFQTNPYNIGQLLTQIDNHEIALPNFQRPWVWGPERVNELLISIAHWYPAGSLLSIPIKNSQFLLRPFEGAGEKLKRNPNFIILDGQQRLTSLYQSLKSSNGIEYRGEKFFLYLDVETLMSDPDGNIYEGEPYFEKALFYVRYEKDNKKFRYEGLRKLYELTTREQEIAAGTIPLNLAFNNDELLTWKRVYIRSKSNNMLDLYEKLDKKWEDLVQPWFKRITSYSFPIISLDEKLPLSAICHIFEKVNSTGVPLGAFELATAILWAQNFHLNEEWNKKSKEIVQFLHMQQPDGTYYLYSISLLASITKKRENPDKNIAIICKKSDLLNLDADTVKKWWEILFEGYKEAAMFMKSNGILSTRILPYRTIIIPLSAIFADLKNRKKNKDLGLAWQKISRWYWCSVFSQRYSSQIETNSAIDFEQVIEWIEGGKEPDVVRTFTFRSDALQEITSIKNAMYKGVLCLLAKNGAKDFGGKGTLIINLSFDDFTKNTQHDHHHIFPTDALKKLNVNDPRINTIANKTLIGSSENRSIGASLPSKYIKEWQNTLSNNMFDEILKSHCIDPGKLMSDNFEEFIKDRRERLRKLIEAECGGTVQPFSDNIKDINIEND